MSAALACLVLLGTDARLLAGEGNAASQALSDLVDAVLQDSVFAAYEDCMDCSAADLTALVGSKTFRSGESILSAIRHGINDQPVFDVSEVGRLLNSNEDAVNGSCIRISKSSFRCQFPRVVKYPANSIERANQGFPSFVPFYLVVVLSVDEAGVLSANTVRFDVRSIP